MPRRRLGEEIVGIARPLDHRQSPRRTPGPPVGTLLLAHASRPGAHHLLADARGDEHAGDGTQCIGEEIRPFECAIAEHTLRSFEHEAEGHDRDDRPWPAKTAEHREHTEDGVAQGMQGLVVHAQIRRKVLRRQE